MTDLLRFENETAARDPDFGLGRDGYDAWRGFIVAHALVTRRLDDELRAHGPQTEETDAQKQAEERKAKSEEKYRSLFDTMGEGFALMEIVRDASGRAVDAYCLELNEGSRCRPGYPASVCWGGGPFGGGADCEPMARIQIAAQVPPEKRDDFEKQRYIYLSQTDTYTEYSMGVAASYPSNSPETVVQLTEAIITLNPKSDYLELAVPPYLAALAKSGLVIDGQDIAAEDLALRSTRRADPPSQALH